MYNPIMPARAFVLSSLIFGSIPAQAKYDCPSLDPGGAAQGLCDSYIPAERLPTIQAQQTIVWCWAASAQIIFKYYGFDVSQKDIVVKGYGNAVINTGAPWAMLKTLNAEYTAIDGRHFRVRTVKHHDAYSWLTRDVATARLQTGLTVRDIHNELRQGRPVFYASQAHAMVLVASRHNTDKNETPAYAAVLDPAPAYQVDPGPITNPSVPAKGLRWLEWSEMTSLFTATVEVTPRN